MSQNKLGVVTAKRTSLADVYYIEEHLRDSDREEIRDMGFQGTIRDIEDSYNRSSVCTTFLVEGQPVCIIGVIPYSVLAGVGCIWMVGTYKLNEPCPTLAYYLKYKYLPLLYTIYSEMGNLISAKNTASLKLVKWAGAEVFPAEEVGPNKCLFHRILFRRDKDVLRP